jgi:hypothetical protein
MAKIFNFIGELVAYVCVATVITLALVVGYLRYTEQLTNEKLFRVIALLQDVDLEQIEAEQTKSKEEVPPKEMSLHEVMHQQQVKDRNFELKLLALQSGRQEYDEKLKELREQTARFDRQAQDFQSKLREQERLTTQENVAKVVSQLEQVKPDVGKASLMRWIDEGRMDDAILLMGKMSETKLAKILRTFETPQELDKLHEIHQRILTSGGDSSKIEKALNDLKPAAAGS